MAKRPSSLQALSTDDLRRELAARQRAVTALTKRRARLAAAMAEVDRQLAGMGAVGPGKRPRNEKPLAEVLEDVIGAKPLSIAQIIDAVKRAGYQSSSPNFRVIVNQMVIKSGKFKRVGRGMYAVK